MKTANIQSLLILGIAISTCYSSCTYKKGDVPVPLITANNTSTISYAKDIKPILVTYCLGQGTQHCHVTVSNQGSNGDYTSYEGLKAKVDNKSIQNRVFTPGGGMPPSYSTGAQTLAPDDLAKFKQWVTQGALNN